MPTCWQKGQTAGRSKQQTDRSGALIRIRNLNTLPQCQGMSRKARWILMHHAALMGRLGCVPLCCFHHRTISSPVKREARMANVADTAGF